MRESLPRLMIAAPGSGSGKTLITCGFLELLKRRGLRPHAYKCGPDYIDPMFHRYVLGVPGGSLDSFFLSEEALCRELKRAEQMEHAASIAVLEGVMGYYDGLGGICTKASSYEVACMTKTPVILVVNAKGASLSLAAQVKGFLSFRKDSRIGGVILNRLSPMLYDRLGPVIEKECGIPVFGYLPESENYRLESRHLGLFLPGEIPHLRQIIEGLAEEMERTLDIDAVLKMADLEAGALSGEDQKEPGIGDADDAASQTKVKLWTAQNPVPSNALRPRIGVARDEAFCFYYQENLRLMEEMGAELVCFSPLHDRNIPTGVTGLLLGGGYPENYAKELSQNSAMRDSVREAVCNGIPLLAECGGFLYLHKSLEGSDGGEYPMAGILDRRAFRTGHLSRFGYLTLHLPDGETVKGHEFHYWESENPGEACLAVKPAGGKSWRCMYAQDGQIYGFPHLYYPSNPSFLARWLNRCRRADKNK